jgi:DnaK suppressor protein
MKKKTESRAARKARAVRLDRMLRSRREEHLVALERQLGKQVSEDVLAALDEQIEIGDRSVTVLGQEVELGVVELKRKELHQIDGALARLRAGTYGLCEECGAEIDEERLEILPFAAQCVDCKRRRETEEKQIVGGFRSGFRDLGEGIVEDEED